MRTLIIGVVIIALVAIAAFLFVNSSRKDNNTTSTGSISNEQGNSTIADTTLVSSSVTITYTDNGFSPSNIKVTSGGSVTVKNNSGRTIQFDSNPHPAHTDNAELNLGSVGAGESKSFTVTKKGTWEYHDHLNASAEGTIVVE